MKHYYGFIHRLVIVLLLGSILLRSAEGAFVVPDQSRSSQCLIAAAIAEPLALIGQIQNRTRISGDSSLSGWESQDVRLFVYETPIEASSLYDNLQAVTPSQHTLIALDCQLQI